jgi:3-deoxy-D-manno-octulosonic-acid transferase
MWKIIYNIIVNLAVPPFIIYGLTKKKIRKNLFERFSVTTKGLNLKDTIWIHAASVGEAAIAENLMNSLKQRTTQYRFIFTTNTYYTRDMLRTKLGKDVSVFSMPFDLSYLISRFIDTSQFKGLVIIETEIWPNLIWQASKYRIPVVIVNGRISDKTVTTYRRFSSFLNHVLKHVSHVAAQSEEHRQRFISIGMDPEKVSSTGNIKYSRALKEISNNGEKENVITFGSIKEKELEIVVPVIVSLKKEFPDSLVYIAPREIHLASTIETELSKSFSITRFSSIKAGARPESEIVIVDTIGDLVNIYGKSMVAFVGGSLAPYGGQNILEPLFFGTPVIFGPYMENFKEIAQIVLENKAGIMVNNGQELYSTIKKIMSDEPLRQAMGTTGKLIIRQQQNVMNKTVDIILNITEGKNKKQEIKS